MKQNTAMQDLIEFIESNGAIQIEDIYLKAKSSLKKEEEQIKQSYVMGWSNSLTPSAQEYFNQTYNNQ